MIFGCFIGRCCFGLTAVCVVVLRFGYFGCWFACVFGDSDLPASFSCFFVVNLVD